MNFAQKIKILLPRLKVERSKTLSVLQLVMAALFFISASLMCFVFIKNQWSAAARDVIAKGETTAGLLAPSAQAALAEDGTAAADNEFRRLLPTLHKDTRLISVELLNGTDQSIVQSGSKMLTQKLDDIQPADSWASPETSFAVYAAESGKRYYEIERHVSAGADGATAGSVRLLYEMPSLLTFAGMQIKRCQTALFGLALLLLIGNYLLHLYIQPISALKSRLAEAPDDDFDSLKLDFPKNGEAGEIAAGIDRILSNAGNKCRNLQDNNRELQVSNRVILFEKRRTESIIDSLSEGVIVTDAYGRISIINHEAENLLGMERNGVLGKPTTETFADSREICEFITADDQSSGRRTGEFDLSNGEGKKIIRMQYTPLARDTKDAGRRTGSGGLAILQDVTQLKMEEHARRDFISNVAHELRAPLSAIKSYVEMLIDNEADTPELRAEFFNTINEEADRLARLIDNMLNISKIEIGGLVLNKSTVKTRRLLEDALASVYGTAKGKNIEIESSLPEDMPDADIDKEMVRTVIMNLLGNAIKYTNEGGNIMLTAEVDAEELRVHVTDTGWGIPEDEQEKVFEKFYRGRQTGSTMVTGNGLGLALAKEIACLHGGDLRLKSVEGKGSKFSLHLPLQ